MQYQIIKKYFLLLNFSELEGMWSTYMTKLFVSYGTTGISTMGLPEYQLWNYRNINYGIIRYRIENSNYRIIGTGEKIYIWLPGTDIFHEKIALLLPRYFCSIYSTSPFMECLKTLALSKGRKCFNKNLRFKNAYHCMNQHDI